MFARSAAATAILLTAACGLGEPEAEPVGAAREALFPVVVEAPVPLQPINRGPFQDAELCGAAFNGERHLVVWAAGDSSRLRTRGSRIEPVGSLLDSPALDFAGTPCEDIVVAGYRSGWAIFFEDGGPKVRMVARDGTLSAPTAFPAGVPDRVVVAGARTVFVYGTTVRELDDARPAPALGASIAAPAGVVDYAAGVFVGLGSGAVVRMDESFTEISSTPIGSTSVADTQLVATSDGGAFLATITRSPIRLETLRISAAGVPDPANVVVPDFGIVTSSAPVVAESGGTILVTYLSNAFDETSLLGIRFDRAGLPLDTTPLTIAAYPSPYSIPDQSTIASPSGWLALVGREDRATVAAIHLDVLGRPDAPVPLGTAPAQMAYGYPEWGGGRYLVGWSELVGGLDAQWQRGARFIDAAGRELATPVTLSGPRDSSHGVAAYHGAGFLQVWADELTLSGGDFATYGQRVTVDGDLIDEEPVLLFPESDEYPTFVTFSGTGFLLYVEQYPTMSHVVPIDATDLSAAPPVSIPHQFPRRPTVFDSWHAVPRDGVRLLADDGSVHAHWLPTEDVLAVAASPTVLLAVTEDEAIVLASDGSEIGRTALSPASFVDATWDGRSFLVHGRAVGEADAELSRVRPNGTLVDAIRTDRGTFIESAGDGTSIFLRGDDWRFSYQRIVNLLRPAGEACLDGSDCASGRCIGFACCAIGDSCAMPDGGVGEDAGAPDAGITDAGVVLDAGSDGGSLVIDGGTVVAPDGSTPAADAGAEDAGSDAGADGVAVAGGGCGCAVGSDRPMPSLPWASALVLACWMRRRWMRRR